MDKNLGWIATNAHVTGTNPAFVEVAFNKTPFEKSQLVYIDQLLDLAVLQLPLAKIPDFAEEANLECQEEPIIGCLLYTSPSPRDGLLSRMPSAA